MKNPFYIQSAILFWVIGFIILALSKEHYNVAETHMIFGRSMADVAYYIGDHFARVLLMVGTLCITFALERYNYNDVWVMYAKNTVICIIVIFFIRMIGEFYTYSIRTRCEGYLMLVAVIIGIAKTILWHINKKLKQNGY